MSSGGDLTTYEVYILQNGRWSVYGSFKPSQRAAALEEAKELEGTTGIGGVKVIKEVWSAATNESQELVVYTSPKIRGGAPPLTSSAAPAAPAGKKPPPPKSAEAPRKEPRKSEAAEAPRKETAKPAAAKKKPAAKPVARYGKAAADDGVPAWVILYRSLMVIVLSLGCAALLTGLLSMLLPVVSSFGIIMSQSAYSNILFGAFLFTFVVSAILLYKGLVAPLNVAASNDQAQPVLPQAPPRPASAPPTPPRAVPSAPAATAAAAEPPAPDAQAIEEEREARIQARRQAEEERERKAREKQLASEKEAGTEEKLSPSLKAEKERSLMTFVGEALATIKDIQLDAYNKFGMHLLLAGACEIFSSEKQLSDRAAMDLLRRSLELLGTKPEQAKSFCAKYEEYLLQPRYLEMFNAGKTAMAQFMASNPAGVAGVPAALKAWGNKNASKEKVSSVTVMFTDLVGSTDMTQRLGNEKAQGIVRTHNAIVRKALTTYGGTEIKHTGDGIMASFAKPADGVKSCMDIQIAVFNYNLSNPEMQFHLRIGINSGEAIKENEDLFGSTVQLAARVCAAADTEQIFTSPAVREACARTNIVFKDRGERQMKGFKDKMTVFEVMWRAVDN